MWTDIKKIIAVKLLSAAFSIMPDCEFKVKLAELFRDNLMDGL